MITREDFEYIAKAFHYALLRMEELPIHHWGSPEMGALVTRDKNITEARERQHEILKKLEKLVGDNN